jgi:hypothetical protein
MATINIGFVQIITIMAIEVAQRSCGLEHDIKRNRPADPYSIR